MQVTPQILLTAIALGICTGAGTIYFMAKKSKAIWGTLGISSIPVLFYLAYQLAIQKHALNLSPENVEAMLQFCLLTAFGSFVGLVAVWGNWIDGPSQNETSNRNDKPYY
jgi:hypothetical protein